MKLWRTFLLLIFLVILTGNTLTLGLSFTSDGFENGTGNWVPGKGTPSTSTIQKHSGNYSYVTDEELDVIYQQSNINYNKVAVLWFYDNASDLSFACMARVDNGYWNDSYSWRGLGVATGTSSSKYVYRVGSSEVSTTVTRTTGWHQFVWDYRSGTKVDLYIDGSLVASPTGTKSFNGVAMGTWWVGGYGGTGYFDDFSIQDNLPPFTSDSFEYGIENWQAGKGTPSTSVLQKYSGNFSYLIDEDQEVIYQQSALSYRKVVGIWFYDDASDESYTCMARVDNGPWDAETTWRGLGVDTQVHTRKYVYRVGTSVNHTAITRTTGWHQFLWDYRSGNKVDLYIDGILVASPIGVTSFNSIAMGNWRGGAYAGIGYFDDFSIQDILPPLTSDGFENGTGNWSAGKGTPSTSTVQKHSGKYSYVTNEELDVIYQQSTVSYNKVAVLWFYDNADDIYFACMARVDNGYWDDSYSWRGLGVSTDINPSKYVYRVGANAVGTTITRTTGWHQFVWDYRSGTKVDLYIDGSLVASPTEVTSFSRVAMGTWWVGGYGGTGYFDDFSIRSDLPSFSNDTIVTLNLSKTTDSSVFLSWSVNSNTSLIDHYNVYRNGILQSSLSATSYTDAGLASGITYTYYIQTVDYSGNTVDSNFVSITPVNQPPVLNSIGDQNVKEGDWLEFTIDGWDPDGDPLTYSATGLPFGATFDPSARSFRWIPDFNQARKPNPQVTFKVTDGRGGEDLESFIIIVGDVPPPEIVSNSSFDNGINGWYCVSDNATAQAETSWDTADYDTAPGSLQLLCTKRGSSYKDIQLLIDRHNLVKDKMYLLTFKAKSSAGFTIPYIKLNQAVTPWADFATPYSNLPITTQWQSYAAIFTANATVNDARLTFFLGNAIPDGATFNIDTVSLKQIVVYPPSAGELLPNPNFDQGAGNWNFYTDASAQACGGLDATTFDSAPVSYRIQCINHGDTQSSIQLFTMPLTIVQNKTYQLTFRAKSTGIFAIPSIRLMKAASPWTLYANPYSGLTITHDWQSYTVIFTANSTANDGRLTFFLGNALPDGATFWIDSLSLREVGQ